jgi:hypothetical protein
MAGHAACRAPVENDPDRKSSVHRSGRDLRNQSINTRPCWLISAMPNLGEGLFNFQMPGQPRQLSQSRSINRYRAVLVVASPRDSGVDRGG